MEETEIIHVGWNSQRDASNTKQNPGSVEDALNEKDITKLLITNIILAP